MSFRDKFSVSGSVEITDTEPTTSGNTDNPFFSDNDVRKGPAIDSREDIPPDESSEGRIRARGYTIAALCGWKNYRC